jgi:hypothetical protein
MCVKYQMHYDLLIYNHGTETKPDDGAYYERHHVKPKSLGGSNEPSNLVYLTGKAHYIAHHLLFKIHGVGPMASAFWAMCNRDTTGSRYQMNSRSFETARVASASASSVFQKGVPKSEETKRRMSKPRSAAGKANMKKTPETRAKMSASHLLRYKLLKESNNG